MTIAIVVFIVGLALLALSGLSFRIRAIANKPAWNGLTRPLLLFGLIIFAVCLVLLYFAYRHNFG